jgi:hypothetical protein
LGIADGFHCRDAKGDMDITALALLVDMALGASARQSLTPGARLATTRMQIQLTGAPLRGDVSVDARLLGFTSGSTLRQSMSSANGVCRRKRDRTRERGIWYFGSSTGRQARAAAVAAGHSAAMRTAHGARSLRGRAPHTESMRQALAKATPHATFIQHFWAGIPRRTARGATSRVAVGLHLGNRVGHAQGGIMLGIAATTASVAAPANMRLSNASAWYISPGQG